MALVMLGLALLLLGITIYSGRTMDRDAIARQQALIDNSFTTRLNRAVGELRSVAWWDDTVKYTAPETFDEEWLEREIGTYMYDSYHHDRLIIVDEHDKPVYVYGEGTGLGTAGLARDMKAIAPVLRLARGGPDVSPRIESTAAKGELYEIGATEGRKYSRGFGAIIQIDGKPALAQALLITPSFDTAKVSPVRRVVLTIIDVTPAVLTEMGRGSLMPDLSFQTSNEKRLGEFDLRADDGRLLARLNWTPKQPGTEMVQRVLPGILAVIGVSVAFLLMLMMRLFASTKQLALREADARFLADHDALTGLPNRRLFADRLGHCLHARGGDPAIVAVVLLDLERFRRVNDTLGRQAGDELLRAVGARLQRQNESAAHLGADLFGLVLRGSRSASEVNRELERVMEAVFAAPLRVNEQELRPSCRAGIALHPADGDDADALLRNAEAALRGGKRSGERVVFYAPDMNALVAEALAIENKLRQAVERREFVLHYQPKVRLEGGAIVGAEALIRWRDPQQGLVPPGRFIPVLEETGMIVEVGRWAMQQAFADLESWIREGLHPPRIAVNVSSIQLQNRNFVDTVIGEIERGGDRPELLELEITESLVMRNVEDTTRKLSILRGLGVTVSVDDFGTGYSSLAYLSRLPVDKLKIDRSFVANVAVSPEATALVTTMISLAHGLKLEVVAEGVETAEQARMLGLYRCDEAQGYLFGRPMSAEEFAGRLRAARAPAAPRS